VKGKRFESVVFGPRIEAPILEGVPILHGLPFGHGLPAGAEAHFPPALSPWAFRVIKPEIPPVLFLAKRG
jgi:hypothetical protein